MTEFEKTEPPNPVHMEYQGIGIRFVSIILDSLIISAIFGALAAILGFGMMRHGSWSVGLLFCILYRILYLP
jgi:uncharacterized RDD family membrane protein YckC